MKLCFPQTSYGMCLAATPFCDFSGYLHMELESGPQRGYLYASDKEDVKEMSTPNSSSLTEHNFDLSELLKNLYFLEDDPDEKSASKPSSHGGYRDKTLPPFMEDSLSAELLDTLWQNRAHAALQEGMKVSFLSPRIIIMALKGNLNRLKNQSILSQDVLIKFKKAFNVNKEARLDFLRRAFSHYYLKFIHNQTEIPWQQVCALALCKAFLDFDLDISGGKFREAMANEDAAKELLGNFENVLPILKVCGLLQFYTADKDNQILESLYANLAELKEYSFATIDDLIKFETFLQRKYLPLKRKYARLLNKLKKSILANLQDESVASLKKVNGWSFVAALDKAFPEIQERARRECESFLPGKFSASELLAEIARITPPLREADLKLAREEVDALEKGELKPEHSWILQVILPVIRGEQNTAELDLDALAEAWGASFPYSQTFTMKLGARQYSLGEPPQDVLQETIKFDVPPENEHISNDVPEDETPVPQECLNKDEAESEDTAPEDVEKINNDRESEAFEAAGQITAPEEMEEYPQPFHVNVENSSADDRNQGNNAPSEKTQASDLEKDTSEESASFFQEKDANLDDMEEEAALTDFTELEGVFDASVANFLRKEELAGLGNLGHLVGKAPSTEQSREKSDRPRQKRVQERSKEELLDSILTGLMLTQPEEQENETEEIAIEEAIALLLDHEDTAGLYWLAESLKENETIPLWLAEMLHIGSKITARTPAEHDRFARLLKEAIAVESLDDRKTLLLASAILRPALIMPMMDMSTALQTLENSTVLRPVSRIFKKLKELVFSNRPIPQTILQGQSGKQLAESSLAALRERTDKFLRRMRTAKTQYQPATDARRHMFGPQGELGRALEECLSGNYASLEESIIKLEDSRTYDDIINRNRSRKTNTRNIEAGVREELRKNISDCRELLEEWRDLVHNAERGEADSRADWYHDTFNFKNLQFDAIADTPESRFFIRQLEALQKGLSIRKGAEPMDELELWPLRLSFFTGIGQAGLKPETLIGAVMKDEQNNEQIIAGNLVTHAARGHYPEVRKFINAWPDYGEKSALVFCGAAHELTKCLPFTVDDGVNAAERIWKNYVEERLQELENLIVDSYFRGAININQQNEVTLKLHDLKTAWKEKRNALATIAGMNAIDVQLSRWDDSMRDEVIQRLDNLKEKANGLEEAIKFLEEVASETIADKSYSVAHDNIARMETWLNETSRPFPKRALDMPSLIGVGKEFYDLLESGDIQPLEKKGREWRDAGRLANFKSTTQEFVGALTSLLRWLGFSLARKEQIKENYSEGKPHYWRLISYNMDLKSPLPHWGTRANGHHVIAMGWNSPSPADIDKLMQSGRFHQNDAVTLIVFGSLSSADRLKLLKMGKDWDTFPLIIDTNVFYYLANQPEEQRIQRMFEICLAGAPAVSSINPYTPDAKGDVPKEMFYGRKKDLASVRDLTGACVIFGGRQLGKSAILSQIANEPQTSMERVVLRKSLPEEATSLLEEALICCIKHGIVHPNTSRKTFPDKIREWINKERGRELLLLLDECDNVLERDRKDKFPEVKTLRDLMQDTQSRFKVVFTGLHSVQRFSHEPNSPFYQLKSICIGPMDTDSAYQLMTAPLSLLGINFESQKLVRMALNYCSYQPKLIQMFCHELLDAVGNIPDRGPVYTIDRGAMLKVYASPRLREKIRDSFTMTLALDKRYFVIAYVMALNSPESMTSRKLLAELRDYWPAAFDADNCDVNSLQTLLQEMEGLGLLISLEGGWRVRTPNIIELLGGLDNIWDELEQYKELPYEQPGNPDALRMKNANILTASQYNLLADKSSGLHWISGWSALGLDRVPETLKTIANSKKFGTRITCVELLGTNMKESLAFLRKEYNKMNEGGILAWISSSNFPGNIVDFMQYASDWLSTLRTDKKYVKIICLLSPRDLFRFITKGYAISLSSHEIQLQPWSMPGMESYFLEKDMPANRTSEIMEATNGWPLLVDRLIQAEALNTSRIREEADAAIIQSEAKKLLQEVPKAAQVISNIIDLTDNEPIQREDLGILIPDGMDATTFDYVVTFLQTLSLLRETRDGLKLDSMAFPPKERV